MVSIRGYTSFVPIAKGGFSQVFEAVQAEDRLRRKVAVKVLSVDNQAVIDRNQFTNECRALGEVSDHPNIITVFDSGFTDRGYPFIAMELCDTDLARRITDQPNRCIDPRQVVDIGARIATALAHAHKKGILHRDIKPQNILFNEHGVRLTDFGIASLPGDAKTEQSWALSRHYAAPEVLDEEPYTEASDLYSLGATLYTALDGRRPFDVAERNQPEQVAARIRNEPVPAFSAQEVPNSVTRAIESLLAKHPQDRPRSAEDVAHRFEELARQLDGLPTAVAAPLAAPESGRSGVSYSSSPSSSRRAVDSNDEEQLTETTTARDRSARPTSDFEEAPRDRRAVRGFAAAAAVIVLGIASVFFFGGTDEPECPPECEPEIVEAPAPVVGNPELPSDIRRELVEDDQGDRLVISWDAIGDDQTYRVYPTRPATDVLFYPADTPPIEIPLTQLLGTEHCFEFEAIANGRGTRSEKICPDPISTVEPEVPKTIAEELGEIEFRQFWLELSTSVPRLGDSLANENEQFTVFVPSAEELREFRALLPRDKDDVYLETLEFHVLESALGVDDLLPGVSLTTQAGVLLVGQDGSLPNDATIARKIETANGVIYVLDGLMLPPGVQVLEDAERATADLNDLFRLEPIQFDADDDVILPSSIPTLERAVAIFQEVPEGSRLEIQGHTDSEGSAAYNLELGQRRADSVRSFLIANGVEESMLVATSRGEDELKVDPEQTEADKAANRRIEWFVISIPG